MSMRSRLPSRPNRMSLAGAGKVSSSPTKEGPTRRKQDGPFGGMNLREAKIRGVPERPSAAQERRSSRLDRGDKDDKKGRGFHALKMQRALSPVSYTRRSDIKDRIKEVDSFEQFALLDSVKEAIYKQALPEIESHVPTPVQRIAVPALLGNQQKKGKQSESEQYLIAAETGSGKTLSYLIPTINAVKIAEAKDAEIEAYEKELQEEKLRQNNLTLVSPPLSNMPHPTTGRPRAIILVPTSELVTQVGTLVKAFGHTVKFKSAMISSNFSGKVIRNRLSLHLELIRLSLGSRLLPLTSAIIDRATPSLEQLVLCSATIPRSLDSFLRKRFPSINRLVTPNLHAIPRRVQLGVVDVERDPYRNNKNLACADTIWTIGKAAAEHDGPVKGVMDVKRILVFVNEREKTQEVADYLKSKGIDAIALSRDTPEERQSEMLASFTSSARLSMPKPESHPGSLSDNQPNYVPFGKVAPPVKRQLPNTKVLVTTDLGSRGIDTVAVRHVILYDVPHSTIDFIHRLGRTGRMGREEEA
ncbi:ATP-dependent RNA helicase mrh-4 [Botrytis cinerea]